MHWRFENNLNFNLYKKPTISKNIYCQLCTGVLKKGFKRKKFQPHPMKAYCSSTFMRVTKKTFFPVHASSFFAIAAIVFFAMHSQAAPCGHPRQNPQELLPARVSDEKMREIYEETKTPYKCGIVVEAPKGMLADSPSVFQKDGKWYMYYIIQDGSGYSTHIAESPDLLNWKYKGEILKRKNNSDWDSQQSAGYAALFDHNWGGSNSLEKFEGKYWMSYLGGALKGYETDPLSIGIARAGDCAQNAEWERLPRPALSPSDAESRYFEKLTLYKSNIIYDKNKTLGARFVMYYNAKTESGYERIGIAVSDDMENWRRFGKEPVIDNGKGLSGDPQIVKIGDVWVMFYFGAGWGNPQSKAAAFDTFACSYDLVNWTKWNGKNLVEPSESFDKTYAHKPWLLKHNGIVYHFYCAVGDRGRAIALATSKDLREKIKK